MERRLRSSNFNPILKQKFKELTTIDPKHVSLIYELFVFLIRKRIINEQKKIIMPLLGRFSMQSKFKKKIHYFAYKFYPAQKLADVIRKPESYKECKTILGIFKPSCQSFKTDFTKLLNLNNKDAKIIYLIVCNSIIECLLKYGGVLLPGLGFFEVVETTYHVNLFPGTKEQRAQKMKTIKFTMKSLLKQEYLRTSGNMKVSSRLKAILDYYNYDYTIKKGKINEQKVNVQPIIV